MKNELNQPLGRRQRFTVLAICCLSLLLVGIDITAVNVALPSMARDLGTGISGLQWAVDGYTVVLASLLMFSGSMGDRLGRKRVFVTGLSVFSAASLLCSIAPTIELLVAARVVQAIGASMLNPVAVGIITNTFTDPRERAQAIGLWGAVVGLAMALGPIVGGVAVSAVDWRAIFWINVPIGLLAIGLTLRLVPESRAPQPRRPDPVGQLLVIVLFASLTAGIIEAPHAGWTSPGIVAAGVVAAGSLLGLLAYEPRREQPLIDTRFFRSIPFTAATLMAVAAFAAFGGFLFLNTLYLQGVRGESALGAGLMLLPMALMTAVVSPLSGRIVGRRGPRIPLVSAGVCIAAACLLMTGLTPSTAPAQLLAAYVLFGLGFGAVNAPITNAAVSGMPRAQAGVAAAVTSTSRQVGQTLGVAVAGAVLSAGLAAAGSTSGASAMTAAGHPVWWGAAACGFVIAALGILASGVRAEDSARRVAAELNPEALTAPGS